MGNLSNEQSKETYSYSFKFQLGQKKLFYNFLETSILNYWKLIRTFDDKIELGLSKSDLLFKWAENVIIVFY